MEILGDNNMRTKGQLKLHLIKLSRNRLNRIRHNKLDKRIRDNNKGWSNLSSKNRKVLYESGW